MKDMGTQCDIRTKKNVQNSVLSVDEEKKN